MLHPCPACGKSISMQAYNCPGCGQPIRIRPAAASGIQVTDINMPFASMTGFMVKWAFASIPAVIILFFAFWFFVGLAGGLIKGLSH